MNLATERLLRELHLRLPHGRAKATSASLLAAELGVSTRTIGQLASELVDRGVLVGSTCATDRPGYFVIVDEDDLRVGLGHVHSRAVAMMKRMRVVRSAALAQFSRQTVLELFPNDMEEVGVT